MTTTHPTSPELLELANKIRCIPDFPVPGILFRDISTLLRDPQARRAALQGHLELACGIGPITHVIGADARGFLFGLLLAEAMQVPFSMARKPGKLPGEVLTESYSLEYGSNSIQIQADAIKPGDHVLLVDDLLATGGTMAATARLIERLGGVVVGIHVLIELVGLDGRALLEKWPVKSVLQF